jgi:hypothetical protein
MAENSNIYMPLVQSNTFTARVQYILAMEAPTILAEASGVSGHPLRAALAARIAVGPASYAPVFAVFLATNINVTSGGTLTGSGATLDTPATDAALLAAVASLWSTVAGVITNP